MNYESVQIFSGKSHANRRFGSFDLRRADVFHPNGNGAFALGQRFEFWYTPKAASWLNMIEIEFSALTRLCLTRRIPTLEKLQTEVLALIEERKRKGIKINWQFSIAVCRQKLNSRYTVVNDANSKFAHSATSETKNV